MIKALLKKQYMETFRMYFVNRKTGKARSKWQIIGLFLLYGALIAVIASTFFGLGFLLGEALLPGDYAWLYYSIAGIIAIALGTFGSVFNTFALLYSAKDNDLLLSMPIPPSAILISRIAIAYGLSLLYGGAVWLPMVIYSWIFHRAAAITVIFGILLTFIIAAFVTVLTCALGWLIALVASRLKNNSFITVAVSLVFICGYYYLSMKLGNIVQLIAANSEAVGNKVKVWGNYIYQLGKAADGSVISMLIFTLVTAVLLSVCFFILSKSFMKIVTRVPAAQKKSEMKAQGKKYSQKSALLRRELKRFTSSSLYMLNCGLGIIFLPIISVITLFKSESYFTLKNILSEMLPGVVPILPMAVVFIVCIALSIDVISTPSISLEGKNLWILRSLPVPGEQILSAKLTLHTLLNSVSGIISSVILCISIKADVSTTILICAFILMYVWVTGTIGLLIGLKTPNFTWTTEVVPIKQSLNVLYSMLCGVVITLIVCAGSFFLRNVMDLQTYLSGVVVIFAIIQRLLYRVLYTKGCEMLNSYE